MGKKGLAKIILSKDYPKRVSTKRIIIKGGKTTY